MTQLLRRALHSSVLEMRGKHLLPKFVIIHTEDGYQYPLFYTTQMGNQILSQIPNKVRLSWNV